MSYSPKRIFQFDVSYDGNQDNYRIKSQIGSVQFRYTCKLPDDLKTLVSLKLYGNVSTGAAQTNRDIDRFVSAHQEGEVLNQKTASDTSTLWDLSTYVNKTYGFEFIDILPSPTGGDIIGINMDHNAIGGTIYYLRGEGIYYI